MANCSIRTEEKAESATPTAGEEVQRGNKRPAESEDKAYTLVDQESQIQPILEKLRDPSANGSFLAVDCEGEELSRRGKLSIVSVGTESHTYLFDIKALGAGVFDQGLRDLLEDSDREKLMFDCRADSDCLWHLFKVKLANVLDLQLLQVVHNEEYPEQLGYSYRPRGFQLRLRGFRKCLDLYVHDWKLAQTKDAGFQLMKDDKGKVWMKRPLQEKLLEYAAADVQGAFLIYQKLKQALDTPDAKTRLRVGSQNYLNLFRSKVCRTHDKYELNAFLPWRVLPKSGDDTSFSQIVTCTGCKNRFPRGDFLSYQMKAGVQKCPVCRKN